MSDGNAEHDTDPTRVRAEEDVADTTATTEPCGPAIKSDTGREGDGYGDDEVTPTQSRTPGWCPSSRRSGG